MESSPPVTSRPTYQSMFDRAAEETEQGPELQSDSDVYTQPVARRPIDPQCGGAGDGGGIIAPFDQRANEHAPRLSYDGDLGSPRPM
jgi:hypothetical protein